MDQLLKKSALKDQLADVFRNQFTDKKTQELIKLNTQ